MTDNLNRIDLEEPEKITLNEPWEVRYWTKEFGITEAKLRRAVVAVGAMSSSVRIWVRRH
ncbi:DUF3606 domain-containing protein [Psychromonas sp. Urea-02u-13]|uniref:DUF3606 domain-containing protein n=1 Tax=Psychromonas sp. Urea-02u-13 TaxID=2058326 RepID=UPI000C34BFA1|nr:DUF3606 domain-containing protein [Psychromonas sp. Urea-02u-13]